MTELEKIIANLGYPVGMGMAPSPADLARMKSAMTDELWTDDEVEHEMALAQAEIERLQAALEEQNGAIAIMHKARNAIIEECAKAAEKWLIEYFGDNNLIERRVASAIRALKERE